MEELICKEKETRDEIANILNKSGLPAIFLREILKDFEMQVNALVEQQYIQAQKKKEESKNEEN